MFRAKRVAAALIPVALLLAACGSEKSVGLGDKTIEGWKAVSISGTAGTAPTVKWNGQMSPVDETETKTLVPGTGDVVKAGDHVNAYVWVGDGYSQKQSYSDYDTQQPEELVADAKSLSKVFEKLLVGTKMGSRVAAIADASEVFGEAGNPQLGIANEDPLVIILDVVSRAVTTPTDTTPDKLPSLVQKGGKVIGLDFKGLTKPDPATGPFLRATIKAGKGATVTADDTVKVNYLGMVFGAKTPFDQSYVDTKAKKAAPVDFPLSQVVKGWGYGLAGVKVGSRVVLQIPPILGYGGKAQENIPGNSTLYFVVDVLSATKPAPSAAASPGAPAGQ